MIDPQATVQIGDTGLRLPRIGLGTASLGNFLSPISDEDAAAVIARALGRGIRYLDTAPLYGHGLAEQRVRAAIAGIPRDELVISTKVGRLLREGAPRDDSQYFNGEPFYKDVPSAGPVWDFSENGIRQSVEESLRRVGVDRFDILLLHDPDEHFEQASTTAYKALSELRADGEVRAIGAGMNSTSVLTKLVRDCDLDVILLAGRYTLLDQSGMDELLPMCVRRTTSVVVGGVFNSGILIDPEPGTTFDYVPASAEVLDRARRIRGICARHDVPMAAAAVQFPLAHPQVCSVLLGPRSLDELDMDLGLLSVDIPSALWADLRAEGLLRPDAPCPEPQLPGSR
ncbi:aldo/keto reductase [Nonomuraea sp. NEAU-A123]|uniref:aldo/keto reductase n=1 Tax=Nonomuraea sp. NEAU-A123 TaxID=2839649 RepID=UPI001BE48F94|nr:aldo/keto reductase [Nonomuraea sp. NEAU-A123]MBT2231935.1 aldo/keto reductase [Nonomuraea sp. NEAU-A123]